MTTTQGATITVTATSLDTLPSLASRAYAQTGYGDFSQLMADMMALNPGIVDWLGDLDGQQIIVPTAAAPQGG